MSYISCDQGLCLSSVRNVLLHCPRFTLFRNDVVKFSDFIIVAEALTKFVSLCWHCRTDARRRSKCNTDLRLLTFDQCQRNIQQKKSIRKILEHYVSWGFGMLQENYAKHISCIIHNLELLIIFTIIHSTHFLNVNQ